MMQAEKIYWKVEGITCANCALSINRALEKEGLSNISVNAITGDVSFETLDANGVVKKAQKNSLLYNKGFFLLCYKFLLHSMTKNSVLLFL
jgi:Cu+-exporting ATPase